MSEEDDDRWDVMAEPIVEHLTEPVSDWYENIFQPTFDLRWNDGVLEQLWRNLTGRTEWRPVPHADGEAKSE